MRWPEHSDTHCSGLDGDRGRAAQCLQCHRKDLGFTCEKLVDPLYMHKTHPKVGWLLFQAKDSKEGPGMVIHA